MTVTDLVSQLHAAQAQQWADEADAEEAKRRRYPDWQWHLPLLPPDNEYDMTADEQQAWATEYRAERIDARDVSDRLLEARQAHAHERWRTEALNPIMQGPPCVLCGGNAQRQSLEVNRRRQPVCSTCRPHVLDAQREAAAAQKLSNGRTMAQAAAQLVSSTIKQTT